MTTIPRPDVPQTVIRFQGEKIPRILPAAADTVMVPLIHDWGPLGADPGGTSGLDGGAQELLSFDAWAQLYGDSDTPGRTAVAGAFAGENLVGAVGAGAVIAYRMGGSTVAAASVVINTTGVGGVAALTLTGKYKGSRANNFTYTIDVDPSNVLRDRLRLFYKGAVQETYLYLQTDVAGLATAINRRSKMVTAENTEGVATRLAAGSGSLAGGDDGSTIAAADHLAALDALRLAPASILASFDLTDAPTQATYLSWVQAQRDASRPVRWVVGGEEGESIDDALSRTAALADPHVVNFGVGTWHDDLLDKDLSTSQLAPRVAGILAARGQSSSITYAKLGGLHALPGTAPDDSDVEAAVTGGVTVLMPAAAADADVRIAKGVTTWTDDTDTQPVDVFGDPRLVGIMDNYVRDMKSWGDNLGIGQLPVNDDTRNKVYGQARSLQAALLRAGLILPGNAAAVPPIPVPWVVVEVTDNDPVYNDTIPYTFGWQFAKTLNAILGQGTVL